MPLATLEVLVMFVNEGEVVEDQAVLDEQLAYYRGFLPACGQGCAFFNS
jgi:hypothetical protein